MADQEVLERAHVRHVSTLLRDLVRRDVTTLGEDEFLRVLDDVTTLARLSDTLRALMAGDLARRSTPDQSGGGLARRQGFGNAGLMVATLTGATTAGAMRAIEAGRALLPEPVLVAESCDGVAAGPDGSAAPDGTTPPAMAPRFPVLAEASLEGVLSTDVVAVITTGLERLSDRVPSDELHVLEHRLVAKAVGLTVKDVRRLVTHAVARADMAGHEARERQHHADRYLAWSEDHTGMVTLNARLDAVTAAPIRAVIEQMVTEQFRRRRDQDPLERDQRTAGQMRADMLHDMARHILGCHKTHSSGVRTTIVVRMNLSDLNSGEGLGRIDGTTQPVSVSELRRLAGDAGVIPQVLGGPSDILDQGRQVRMFTTAQRLALLERDGGCAKCHAPPEHCEAHHITWWQHGGTTNLNNGIMLCTRCHHDIHRQGWGIEVHDGKPHFIPPPTIDPTQQSQPGGLAAITLEPGDPPPPNPGENSARQEDSTHNSPAREAA